MLIRIVSILFPLFAITALGYFVGRRMKPDLSHANKLNMDVFVPALVFGALVSKDFRLGEYLPLLFATVVIIVGSGLAGWAVARAAGIATKTLVPPMMFNNCGNLGLPLAVLAFGESALAPAVVMFVVSNVIHFSYGAWLLDHHTKLTTVWRSPSILATIAGLTVGFLGIEVWPPLLMSIKMVGDISIPLMLFALGVRLAEIAYQVNEKTENIGARRLYTVMEKLLEEVSFEAGRSSAVQTVVVDAAYVDSRLVMLAQREDLARYVL